MEFDDFNYKATRDRKFKKRMCEELSGSVRFPFRCTICNYGMSLTSGVPLVCPICKRFMCFERITWDEYEKLKTTDGFDEK